ncbi:MAG: hypothetical protein LLF97_07430 [Planctomycetaceae bacterium]|nr:hypothetical protein [Planctomycetaceae bacterium]
MDPFRLCLAAGPVAVYLLLLGAVQLSRRPLLVSGGRDAATLALALSGLVIIGPMELFFPFAAAAQFGSQVWLLLLGLYAMCVVLSLLLLRPRLVIYNISADQLRPVLADLVDAMDVDARWAGDSLVLPSLEVQLYVDPFAAFRCVSLVAIGRRQNHQGWRRLETALGNTLAREEVARSPRGLGLIAVSLAMFGWIVWAVSQEPAWMAQSLSNVAASLLKMAGA